MKRAFNELILLTLLIVLAVACLVVMAGAMSGCAIIPPSHAVVLDDHAGNAKAINAKIQEIDMPTPEQWKAVKLWWNKETETWIYVSDWGHGRRPTPSSQPAKE